MKILWGTVLRWLLGLVFFAAGALKIVHPADFFAEVLTYDVPLPEWFLRLTAVALPWLEVFCGALLLLDRWAGTVRALVAGLCQIYVVMLGQAVVRGLDPTCGCFGWVGPAWLERADVALVRAVLLFAAALCLMTSRCAPVAADSARSG